jgi:hypothetical protein
MSGKEKDSYILAVINPHCRGLETDAPNAIRKVVFPIDKGEEKVKEEIRKYILRNQLSNYHIYRGREVFL